MDSIKCGQLNTIDLKDPRYFITSGGLGTMGYGTGAALGVQAGNMDKTVVNIAGDGSFRMNLNEMITAARYKLPIKSTCVE